MRRLGSRVRWSYCTERRDRKKSRVGRVLFHSCRLLLSCSFAALRRHIIASSFSSSESQNSFDELRQHPPEPLKRVRGEPPVVATGAGADDAIRGGGGGMDEPDQRLLISSTFTTNRSHHLTNSLVFRRGDEGRTTAIGGFLERASDTLTMTRAGVNRKNSNSNAAAPHQVEQQHPMPSDAKYGGGPRSRQVHRTPLNLAICIGGVLSSLCVYGVLQVMSGIFHSCVFWKGEGEKYNCFFVI